MKTHSSEDHFDVVVAGAGVGGISAAVTAARAGCRVALLESAREIGGTGVHSPVALVCTWFDKRHRFINRGLFEEILPAIYDPEALRVGIIQTYHEAELKAAYLRLLAREATLEVRTSCAVTAAHSEDGAVRSVQTADGRTLSAKVFIDSTADGNLSALAGAAFQKGRESDGKLQPGTLTFRVDNVDFRAFGLNPDEPYWARWDNFSCVSDGLLPLFAEIRKRGGTSNPREDILCFPDRAGTSLLFNQTRISGADPTDPASMERAMAEGRKQVQEFWDAVRGHPAFRNSDGVTIFEKLGIREGRRIVGDYILTVEDCLNEARFDDMVVACGYGVDIHDPGGSGRTQLKEIPGSGYYHIPYRCLYARDFRNLLLGSRCISGTHEAHSSYRVMPPVSAIGQACGTSAGLMCSLSLEGVRAVRSSWIRHELEAKGQFTEGSIAAPSALAAHS
jgi:hypothetical protein